MNILDAKYFIMIADFSEPNLHDRVFVQYIKEIEDKSRPVSEFMSQE
jgi:hypothetical protein